MGGPVYDGSAPDGPGIVSNIFYGLVPGYGFIFGFGSKPEGCNPWSLYTFSSPTNPTLFSYAVSS